MPEIVIAEPVLSEMIRHARAEAPLECCGFLTGREGRIGSIVPATNQRRSASAFSVPAGELFRLFRELRRSGRELLGIYHSHPRTPARPSPRDIEEFHYPEAGYWIVSLAGGACEVRCYRWVRMHFEEAPFRVEPPEGGTDPSSCP